MEIGKGIGTQIKFSDIKQQLNNYKKIKCVTHNNRIIYVCPLNKCLKENNALLCNSCFDKHMSDHKPISINEVFSISLFEDIEKLIQAELQDTSNKEYELLYEKIDMLYKKLQKDIRILFRSSKENLKIRIKMQSCNELDIIKEESKILINSCFDKDLADIKLYLRLYHPLYRQYKSYLKQKIELQNRLDEQKIDAAINSVNESFDDFKKIFQIKLDSFESTIMTMNPISSNITNLTNNIHIPSIDYAIPLQSFTKFECKNHDIELKLGLFQFSKYPSFDYPYAVLLNPYQSIKSRAIYKGEWKNGKRNGKGESIWPDGSYFIGFWKNDKAHGKGRLYYPDGDIFDGDWIEGKICGEGVYLGFGINGSKYDGEWLNDKQHGFGVEIWHDGSSYEGFYQLGKKHGAGKFLWTNRNQYKGNFEENNIHGNGIYEWADGRNYSGEWQKNKMHGKGQYKWPDGRIYIGNFVDNKKQGQGKLLWTNGTYFEGVWENDKQNGYGCYYDANGNKRYAQQTSAKK